MVRDSVEEGKIPRPEARIFERPDCFCSLAKLQDAFVGDADIQLSPLAGKMFRGDKRREVPTGVHMMRSSEPEEKRPWTSCTEQPPP